MRNFTVIDSDAPPREPAPIRVQPGVRTETVDAVEDVLINSDCGLFQRGGLIVRVDWLPMKTWDEKDTYVQAIVECGNEFLTETIASLSAFEKYDGRSGGHRPCDPPGWIAKTLKERKSRLRLNILNGVTNCPFIRANGEIVTVPGYHPETGIYYDPREVEFPTIVGNPSKDDAGRALARIKVLFHTFPFVDAPSRSVALSLLLTSIVRRALDFAPGHAFDSPAAGTGKSLITDVVSTTATGERAGVVVHTGDQAEFDKLLGAILMRGVPLIAIDNCEGPLKGVYRVWQFNGSCRCREHRQCSSTG
jgi:putative DNA primase/helicase